MRRTARPDAMLTLSKPTLDRIQLKESSVDQAITAGRIKIEGRREAAGELLGVLDTFPFWFNIVTP
jgi:alkyl sulfatase BDS1-like metallo-beta-lactamase superfamily hydrolase